MTSKIHFTLLAAFMVLLGAVTALTPPAFGILIFCLCVFVIFCWVRPLYGFALVSLSSFLNNSNVVYTSPLRIISERYSLGVIPVVILLIIIAIKIVGNRTRFFHRPDKRKDGINQSSSQVSPYDYLIIIFYLWSAVTIFWTQDIYHGWNGLFNLIIGGFLYFMALYVLTDRKTLEMFLKIIFFGGLILVAIFMASTRIDMMPYIIDIQKNITIECGLITYGRRPGGFAPPQLAANIFIFILFSGYCLCARANKPLRYFLISLSVVFCSAIFASGSKAAAGSFLLCVLSFIVIYPPLRKRSFWIAPLALAAIIGTVVLNSLLLGSNRMTQGGDVNNLSISYRLEFWSVGFTQLREYIFGTGIGGFSRFVDPWPGAHSFYFGILFDVGVIGWLILSFYLVLILAEIITFRNYQISGENQLYGYCFLSFWIAFFIHATVDLAYTLPHIWLFLGVTSALLKIIKKSCIKSSRTLQPNFSFVERSCDGRSIPA